MILRSMTTNTWLSAGLLLTALNLAAGAMGYVYQVLMGRMLSAGDFALFSAIMALAVMCSAPFNALVMLMARRVSAFRAIGDSARTRVLYVRSIGWLVVLGLTLAGLLAATLPTIQSYLKAPAAIHIWLFAASTFIGFMAAVNNGFLQGLQRFAWLGGLGVGGVIAKIAVSVALIAGRNAGVEGALLGVLMATLLVWACGGIVIAMSLPRDRAVAAGPLDPFPWRSFMPATIANIALAILAQVDMVLVNWYFPARLASQYAAASILGKAVLYLPGGLAIALFPLAAERHARKEDSQAMLTQAALATLAMCGAGASFYAACGPRLVQLLYGPEYAEAGTLLALYGFAILPTALIVVAENFLLAKGRSLFTWLFLILGPVELAVIHAWHPNLSAVIAVVGATGATVALVGYGLLWQATRSVNAG